MWHFNNLTPPTMPEPTSYEDVFNDIASQCRFKREVGEEEYGRDSFLKIDSLKEAEDELVDLINYTMFQIVKLRHIRERIKTLTKDN